MATTKILPCQCEHKYQDSKYGKGNRVFNASLKEGEYTCTVCARTKTGVKTKASK